jgi:hypothetical protein
MKVRFQRSYKKTGTGRTVFVYTVSGTKEQMAAYKAAQGDNFVAGDDGQPLWFTTRFIGNNGSLIITKNSGKVVADMSAFDQVSSLCEQYPALAGAIASQGVAKLLGNLGSVATVAASTEAIDK